MVEDDKNSKFQKWALAVCRGRSQRKRGRDREAKRQRKNSARSIIVKHWEGRVVIHLVPGGRLRRVDLMKGRLKSSHKGGGGRGAKRRGGHLCLIRSAKPAGL